MLGTLTEKLQESFRKLSGKNKLTESNIAEAVGEVRLALLDADVNYGVARDLIKRIKAQALGEKVLKAVSPGQQFVKVVHDELVALMGKDEAKLQLEGKPAVIMVCGLQGSGKTTFVAKLAAYLKKEKLAKKPLVAACDLQRPAAVLQLETLGKQASISVYSEHDVSDPLRVARAALEKACREDYDLLIVDTAGRLHIDEEMMAQLGALKSLLKPSEVLFVANATTGQDAVNVAKAFNDRVAVTGSVLTMLDGNARAGAAISITEVTRKPLKFEGIGERLGDIQVFNPHSMADRILGMGDTINLVKKAQEHINEDEAQALEKKMRKAAFSYDDYLQQIQKIKKMGSLKSLLGMLPGVGTALKEMEIDDKELFKVEAIIQSMTPPERMEKCELIPSRRKRIASGSGTQVDDVNRLVKSFKQAKQFFKQMPNKKQLQNMLGGSLWR